MNQVKRARAASKIYHFLPEGCGHVEYPQITIIRLREIKILNSVQIYHHVTRIVHLIKEAEEKPHLKANPPLGCQGFPTKIRIRWWLWEEWVGGKELWSCGVRHPRAQEDQSGLRFPLQPEPAVTGSCEGLLSVATFWCSQFGETLGLAPGRCARVQVLPSLRVREGWRAQA